jgi:hypothetical protein
MFKREMLSVVLFLSVTMLSFTQMRKISAADIPQPAEKFIAGIMGGSMIGLKNPANELSHFNSIPVHYLGFSLPTFPSDIAAESGSTSKTEYILSMVGTYKITDFFGLQSGLNYMINQGMSYVGARSNAQYAPGSLVNVWYTSLDIPLLARFEYKPRDFLVGGFIGPYASIPIGNAHISGAISGKNDDRDRFDPFDSGSSLNVGVSDSSPKMSGISYGISLGMFVGYKAGPGFLVVNASYMRDRQAVKAENDLGEIFTRSAINLNIGYEFRF